MAHMHRACRVGRNKLDIYPQALPQRRAAIVHPLRQRRTQQAVPDRRIKAEVQETRTCHIGPGDTRILHQARCQCLSDDAGLQTRRFGKHHGGIGSHVAMGGVTRRFHRDGGEIETGGKRALRGQIGERRDDKLPDIREEVHLITFLSACLWQCQRLSDRSRIALLRSVLRRGFPGVWPRASPEFVRPFGAVGDKLHARRNGWR